MKHMNILFEKVTEYVYVKVGSVYSNRSGKVERTRS